MDVNLLRNCITKFIPTDTYIQFHSDNHRGINLMLVFISTQVSVLSVFDNREYVQLVMEKFGAGLDLFEFIERDPVLDDPLAAHIFAQVGIHLCTYIYIYISCISFLSY